MATDTDRGVSQVIAVVLLVGIVTVLAGVVALSVTGLGGNVREPAPTFAHGTTYNQSLAGNGQYLNVTFESGQPIDTASVYLDVNGATVVDASGSHEADAVEKDGVIAGQLGAEFTVADTLVLNRSSFRKVGGGGGSIAPTEYVDLSDATVRIVYAPRDTDRTDLVFECEVAFPDCRSGQT